MGVRKKQMAERLKEGRKSIAFAKLNNCPTSPRKMRLVADIIRGKKVEDVSFKIVSAACMGIIPSMGNFL